MEQGSWYEASDKLTLIEWKENREFYISGLEKIISYSKKIINSSSKAKGPSSGSEKKSARYMQHKSEKALESLKEDPDEKDKKFIREQISRILYGALVTIAFYQDAVKTGEKYRISDGKSFSERVTRILLECTPVRHPKRFFRQLCSDFSSYVQEHGPLEDNLFKIYAENDGVYLQPNSEGIRKHGESYLLPKPLEKRNI
jgi:hypothetical protein